MNHTTLAGLAGALLLSTAGLAFAAGGTTIVPAGQSANVEVAQADTSTQQPAASGSSDSGSQTENSDSEAAADSSGSSDDGSGSEEASETSGDDAASDQGQSASTSGSDGSGESEQAASDEGDASSSGDAAGVTDAANVNNPEPAGSPSLDTANETNQVASFKPLDDSQTPGLALDTAEKPVYAFSGDTPDWYAWRGARKYGANCLQCHGPDGMGSSFAPNLVESLKTIDYYEFAGIIVSGQQNQWSATGSSIMPAWGEDPNVMCSLDAIYVYLRGRADGVIGRGEVPRPERTDKYDAAQEHEYSCLGF